MGVADEAAGEAAVEPQGQHLDHCVRRLTRSDVTKTRDHRGADDVVIAENRGPGRQLADDAAQLAAVEHLPMRQVDVGHAELAEVQDLADPVHQRPRGQRDDPGRRRPGPGAPHGQPVDPARQGCPGVVAADPVQQEADGPGRLLHQQQVGLLLGDEGGHVVNRRAGAPQQVPAHDLEGLMRPIGRVNRQGVRRCGGEAGRACSRIHRAGLVPHRAALPSPPRSNAPGAGTFDRIRTDAAEGPDRRATEAVPGDVPHSSSHAAA